MSRLSLRLRLTLVFAAVMALVLAGVGAFLYVRLGNELDEQVRQRLDAGAATLQAVIRDNGGRVPGGALAEQDVAQVIDPSGRLLATTASVSRGPVLDAGEVASARAGTIVLRRRVLDDDPVLLLAEPLAVPAGAVIVVGASLEGRDDAVNGLLTQLAIVIPVALLLASLGGFALAGAALRPVEAMRARAETISAGEHGARLPLPRAHDEVRRLGETLNAMLTRLEEALEREQRFVADASHELRTPLAALRTELDLALRRPRSAQELAAAVGSASEETDRLARLADELLVLARSDAGELDVHRERIAAQELLSTVASRFRARVDEAGRAIDVGDTDGLVVAGDRARLELALGNLVDNALLHGGGPIELDARTERGQVALGVTDRGAGFPPAFLPRAFERFTRADEARAGSSAGLGLAIVEAVASAHGGSAVASSGDGVTRVELRLPAA